MSEARAYIAGMVLEQLHLHESTSIAAAAYDRARRTLRITFKSKRSSDNGRIYDYFDVPANETEALVSAGSHGQFVNWRIKPNFACHEVI